MIYGRGKWSVGAIPLAARDAARRFAWWRGSVSGRLGLWRPLVFRWRQWRARRQNTPTDRAATLPSTLWSPQFHFHYASHKNDRTFRNRLADLSSVTSTSETRVVVEQHWTSGRTGSPPQQRHRTYRPLRPFYAHQKMKPKTNVVFTNESGRSEPPVVHAMGSQVAQLRQSSFLFDRTPMSFRGSNHSKARTESFKLYSQTWQHWLQVFRVRTPTAAIRDAGPSRLHKVSRVQVDHPEELVWRRVKRTPIEVFDVENHQAPAEVFQSPVSRTFQSQQAAEVSTVAEQTALQITKIDPSLLDRLTDDVIRRVEQRARIERQRRGL